MPGGGVIQGLPGIAAVLGAVDSRVSPGENDLGVVGPDRQAPDLRILRQALGDVPPLFFAVAAADDTALTDVVAFAGQADVDVSPMV